MSRRTEIMNHAWKENVVALACSFIFVVVVFPKDLLSRCELLLRLQMKCMNEK